MGYSLLKIWIWSDRLRVVEGRFITATCFQSVRQRFDPHALSSNGRGVNSWAIRASFSHFHSVTIPGKSVKKDHQRNQRKIEYPKRVCFFPTELIKKLINKPDGQLMIWVKNVVKIASWISLFTAKIFGCWQLSERWFNLRAVIRTWLPQTQVYQVNGNINV